jgi:hypothetical protein
VLGDCSDEALDDGGDLPPLTSLKEDRCAGIVAFAFDFAGTAEEDCDVDMLARAVAATVGS